MISLEAHSLTPFVSQFDFSFLYVCIYSIQIPPDVIIISHVRRTDEAGYLHKNMKGRNGIESDELGVGMEDDAFCCKASSLNE